jgi:hypothetical protein
MTFKKVVTKFSAFKIYWTTQLKIDVMQITNKNNYVNFCVAIINNIAVFNIFNVQNSPTKKSLSFSFSPCCECCVLSLG